MITKFKIKPGDIAERKVSFFVKSAVFLYTCNMVIEHN